MTKMWKLPCCTWEQSCDYTEFTRDKMGPRADCWVITDCACKWSAPDFYFYITANMIVQWKWCWNIFLCTIWNLLLTGCNIHDLDGENHSHSAPLLPFAPPLQLLTFSCLWHLAHLLRHYDLDLHLPKMSRWISMPSLVVIAQPFGRL